MQSDSWFHELIEQLKRRRVFRVATLYAVVFWPIIQVIDILSPALTLPDSLMRYLVTAFFVGLPVVLIFAWAYDLNKDGLVRDTGEDGDTAGAPLLGSRVELGIVGVFVLLAAGLFYVQWQQVDSPTNVVTADQVKPRELTRMAVLPFVTFSQRPEDQFFADGLTEELLNVLARIQRLQVAARTTSFAYKGVNRPVQEIGGELGVDVILEGSVRRNDVNNTIRVTAQLIDIQSGAHLWSQTYDRAFSDVLQIQDDVATAVAGELKIQLLGDIETRPAPHKGNPEAIIAASMGRAELAKRSQTGLLDAERYFQQALQRDAQYAAAYVGLAEANTLQASYGFEDRDASLAEADEALEQALSLNQNLDSAWAVKGLIAKNRDDVASARTHFQKALKLNPNNAMAAMWYGSTVEDSSEQLKWYQRAYELDPRSPVAGYNVAVRLNMAGRQGEALAVIDQVIKSDPNFSPAYEMVAQVSKSEGQLMEALRHFQSAWQLSEDPDTAINIADLYVSIGDFDKADKWLAISRDVVPPEYTEHVDWLQAERLVASGQEDEAMVVLRKLTQPNGEYQAAYVHAAYAAHFMGDHEEVVRLWEKGNELSNNGVHVDFDPVLMGHTAMAAIFAYQRLGMDQKADQLLSRIKARLENPGNDLGNGKSASYWYLVAKLERLRGNEQQALISFQRAIDTGWYSAWETRYDPTWSAIEDREIFESMLASIETRMDIIRRQVSFAASFDKKWAEG